MKVIIPAAGFASRLKPHTYLVPKAMLPIANKPIIGHIMEQVIAWGGTNAVIVVGHLHEKIELYVRNNFGIPVEFRMQEPQVGLGHAVMTGLDADDEEVLIILGDTILDLDITEAIARGVTSIGVKRVDDPRKMGVVVTEGRRVTQLVEKPPDPPSDLAIVGIYYIRNGGLLKRAISEIIADGITVKGEYQITDALQRMVEWGERIETFTVDKWYDCGLPGTVLTTNRYLLDKSGNQISKSSTVFNSIIIPPVSISGEVLIENSIIGPYLSIADGSSVRFSQISNSIIGGKAVIERSLLKDSLIGDRVEIRGSYQVLNIGSSSQMGLNG